MRWRSVSSPSRVRRPAPDAVEAGPAGAAAVPEGVLLDALAAQVELVAREGHDVERAESYAGPLLLPPVTAASRSRP